LLLPATAPTDTYTLSLHDALPILPYLRHRPYPVFHANGAENQRYDEYRGKEDQPARVARRYLFVDGDLDQVRSEQRKQAGGYHQDRKSTRLNSSHVKISYAVFCLK